MTNQQKSVVGVQCSCWWAKFVENHLDIYKYPGIEEHNLRYEENLGREETRNVSESA
jgi:hypothetical protein